MAAQRFQQGGVCWSTSENPTVNNICTSDGSGTGSFNSSITDLNISKMYYIRAFAINNEGVAYGNQREFRTEDWQRDVDTEVVEVTSSTGQIWMDRNLGASTAATSFTDEQAYGDLYQWGRAADGHQKRDSQTRAIRSNTDQPGHSRFILARGSPWDWRNPRNDNLWEGVNGVNNPCPIGYRLPTDAEWRLEIDVGTRMIILAP